MNQQQTQPAKPPASQPTQQPAAGKPARQSQAPGVAGGPKSNLAVIIIIIVVGAVIVLGAGGYVLWKYYLKGKLTTTADKATTNSSAKISLKNLEAIFTYPTGTLTKTDHTSGMNYKSELGFTTADKLQTVYNYYLNLATQQKLTVSQKSLEPDLSSGSMTIQGQGYYVDIYLYQYENTEFTVTFYGDNITNDTANTSTNSNTPSNNSSKTVISNDYVIPDSDTRVITTTELTNLTPWQLKVARNEIYARAGRAFVHQDLKCYFAGKSWYKINPNYSDGLLTATENKNIATILAYEQSINSPLLQVDSGC